MKFAGRTWAALAAVAVVGAAAAPAMAAGLPTLVQKPIKIDLSYTSSVDGKVTEEVTTAKVRRFKIIEPTCSKPGIAVGVQATLTTKATAKDGIFATNAAGKFTSLVYVPALVCVK